VCRMYVHNVAINAASPKGNAARTAVILLNKRFGVKSSINAIRRRRATENTADHKGKLVLLVYEITKYTCHYVVSFFRIGLFPPTHLWVAV
jgi:hypothetical protein